MAYDGLTDVFDHVPMGEATDRYNAKLGIGREAQDEFAARSHQRAAEAIKNGLFADEITPVSIRSASGDALEVTEDEGVRAGHHSRRLGPAAAGVRQGRHDHRRERIADLRRCGRGRRNEQGPRRTSSA